MSGGCAMNSAAKIAAALKLTSAGGNYVGNCPACGYKAAFSIRDIEGKTLFRCHVGCDQGAVSDALRHAGLWGGRGEIHAKADFKPVQRIYENPKPDSGPIVARIWGGCIESADTVAAIYLRHRGLTLDPGPDIRFAPRLRHNPSDSDWPAMVAAVRNATGDIVAIHRTFLAIDGTSKAPVTPQKMTLGPIGGGSVRLAMAGPALLVGEGIESTLAAMMLSGLPGWAALSAGGIKALILPPLPIAAKVTIAADNDPVGLEAAYAAADRWAGEGRAVRIAKPPAGQDFNDMIEQEGRTYAA